MKKTLLAGTALLAFIGFVSSPLSAQNISQAISDEQAPEYIAQGRLLVAPFPGVSEVDFANAMKKHGAKVKQKIGNLPVWIVEVPARSERAMLALITHNKHVKFAEFDALIPPNTITINDPSFSSAWQLPKIAAPSAWELARGDGIIVAVLDTGVDGTHPDLAPNMIAGWNTASNSTNTTDIKGHGTWVAGTVGALLNNGIGAAGVAPNVKIMPLRITDDPAGYAYYSDMAEAITWAADHGARIVNLSFGPINNSSTIVNAGQYLINKGGLLFNSAGNDGTLNTIINHPAIITVSATTSADTRASWSTHGIFTDLSAPGAGVYSTARGGGYNFVNGTSFSSPIAAATGALVMSANPYLTPLQVENVLKASTDDLGPVGYDVEFGFGRVNALKAVTLAQSIAVDSTPPTVAVTEPVAGTNVAGILTIKTASADNVGVDHVDIFINGQLLGTTKNNQLVWDTTRSSNGNVTITAYAYDTTGNKSALASAIVTVANVVVVDTASPTAAVTSPANNAVISGNVVTLKGAASDNIGVTSLSVAVDGKTLCTSPNVTTISCNWNTKKTLRGGHVVTVVAKDAAGNLGSASINVVK
ncbi:MAG: S8 family serine peptidase [Alphaproteobacteria bacterium]